MKKSIIISTVFVGLVGGYAFAQSDIFTSAEKAATITAAQAKEAALKAFDGNIVEFEYDRDDATPHYDLEIVGLAEKVDLKVNASTGAVTITEREAVNNTSQSSVKQTSEKVENQVDAAVTNTQTPVQQVTEQVQQPTAKTQTNNAPAPSEQASGMITKAQAIAIAQQKASGTVTEVEYDDDDYEYEIEIKNGNTEYNFEINARTGAIVSFEEDLDD